MKCSFQGYTKIIYIYRILKDDKAFKLHNSFMFGKQYIPNFSFDMLSVFYS